MRTTHAACLAIALFGALPAPAFAAAKSGGGDAAATTQEQDASYTLYKATPPDSQKSVFQFDYGPPASPALNLLGLTPDKTPPAASLKAFVFSTPALFGGQSGQSAAFDFSPAAIAVKPDRGTFDDYQNSLATRLWFRTRISVGALNGDSGGGDASKAVPSKAAAGFSMSLLDYSDPLMAGGANGQSLLVRCYAALNPVVNPVMASLGAKSLSEDEKTELAWLGSVKARYPLPNADKAKLRSQVARYIPGADPAAAAPAPTPPVPPPSAKAQKMQELLQKYADIDDPKSKAFAKAMLDYLALQDPTAVPKPSVPATSPAAPSSPLSDDAFMTALQTEIDRLTAKRDTADTADLKTANAAFVKAGLADSYASCAKQASRLASFSPNLQIGAGVLDRGDAGRLEHLRRDGTVGWAALKIPLQPAVFAAAVSGKPVDETPTWALLGFASGRWGSRESVATGDKTTPLIRADTREAWLGLEFINETFRLAGQYGWTRVAADDTAGAAFSRHGEAYLLSSQLQLGDKDSPIWLGLSYGNGYGTATTLKATTALVTLTYSPAKPPDLAAGK